MSNVFQLSPGATLEQLNGWLQQSRRGVYDQNGAYLGFAIAEHQLREVLEKSTPEIKSPAGAVCQHCTARLFTDLAAFYEQKASEVDHMFVADADAKIQEFNALAATVLKLRDAGYRVMPPIANLIEACECKLKKIRPFSCGSEYLNTNGKDDYCMNEARDKQGACGHHKNCHPRKA